MKWDLTEDNYPDIELKKNHIIGLSIWLEKIMELTSVYGGEWDTLVADLWPNDNYSRLIGHVQMKNVVIGYDTGFRVTAYLENGGIEGDTGDDISLIKKWLKSAVSHEKTYNKLVKLSKENTFEIRLTSWGEGDINDAIEINYK